MIKLITVFAIALSVVVSLETSDDLVTSSLDHRIKRSIDPNFLRRYNHLKWEFRDNPMAFTFLKYFLRNRGQRRERRQVNNFDNGFDSGLVTYVNPNRQPTTQNPKEKKRETTRKRPFRPPMVFF